MTNPKVVNNKLVIKNTSLLYIRMILLMGISLYTSRIVLEALGITNFGIYNVVSGIVTLFSFLNNSMSNAVQRFLSYEIGKGQVKNVTNIFNVSLISHFSISLVVFILAEGIGLFLVNNKLDIPPNRIFAANWVLQLSIIITIISILQVPYTAMILSKEKMGFFAYLSLLEGSLRLIIAYIILNYSHDKLILYSLLQSCVSLITIFIYIRFCKKKFTECQFVFIKERKQFKPILSFVSYNLIGEIAQACTGEGLSIILNMFCGPVVNAARGLANQVNSNVGKFVNNFTQALNPQIIKSYAIGDQKSMEKLIWQGTKVSYFLLYLISLPLLLEMNRTLTIWLKATPEYTATFCRIVLIASLIGCCSGLLSQAVRANGNIKLYQIICSIGGLLSLPSAYIVMKVFNNPIYGMSLLILVQIILYFARLIMTSRIVGISKRNFINKTLFPIIAVTILSFLLPYFTFITLPNSILRFIIVIVISIISVGITSYIIGLNGSERLFIKNIFLKFIHKLK